MQKFLNSLFLLALLACQREIIETIPKGSDYFPTQKGTFVSYNVKEILYEVNKKPQIAQYQLKDVLSETFEGTQPSYRITRYRRNNGIENWNIVSNWSCQKNGNFALRQEFNIPIVVLSFPFQENKTWNGNAYNNLEVRKFEMKDLEKSLRIGQKNFEKTVRIVQRMDSSLVDRFSVQEIYAQNVGLIYKKTEELAYCQDAACFGKKSIESGKIVEMSVFDFGKEK